MTVSGPALERWGCIFIYSGYARLISFEINFITKETGRAELEYMNIHPPPPISVQASALDSIMRLLINLWHSIVLICVDLREGYREKNHQSTGEINCGNFLT